MREKLKMDGHAVTNDGSRQTTHDCGENELRHINRSQRRREHIKHSDSERGSTVAASPMECSPSSLLNLLMRSHHTDNNSTNRTADDDFLPLAPLLSSSCERY